MKNKVATAPITFEQIVMVLINWKKLSLLKASALKNIYTVKFCWLVFVAGFSTLLVWGQTKVVQFLGKNDNED